MGQANIAGLRSASRRTEILSAKRLASLEADAPAAAGAVTGTFIFGGWTVSPHGFLLLDGATVTGGAVTYPALAAMFPGWVSANDLVLPDTTGDVFPRGVPVATAAGVVAGANTHTLAAGNLPVHTHTINHDHAAFNTASGGGHTHGLRSSTTSAGTGAFNKTNTAAGTVFAASTGNHAHSIDVPNFTGASGDGGFANSAVTHTPRNLTVRFAVKY